MNKSKAARVAGFIGALGASAALAGAAVNTTGAYFTDSHDGSIKASTGAIRLNVQNTDLNFDGLLPGDFRSKSVTWQSTTSSGPEDVWLVFPDGGARAFRDAPTPGAAPLGRYGHLKINGPSGGFESNNLASGSAGESCSIDADGHGGSDRAATILTKGNSPSLSQVPYCAPANAILLQRGLNPGGDGSATIEFGYTKVLNSAAAEGQGPATLATFKIVATQPGIRPDDINNNLPN